MDDNIANTSDLSTTDLDEVTGGAKQYPPAIQRQLEAAKKAVADSDGSWDKARVGKGNIVQVHIPYDEGEPGAWVPYAQVKDT
jgi:hypothetical protein